MADIKEGSNAPESTEIGLRLESGEGTLEEVTARLASLLSNRGFSEQTTSSPELDDLMASVQADGDAFSQLLFDTVLRQSQILVHQTRLHQTGSDTLSQQIDAGLNEIEALLGGR